MNIIVDKSKCPQNHPCPAVKVCPVNAIDQNAFNAPTIDADKCIKCRKYVMFCPMEAIQPK